MTDKPRNNEHYKKAIIEAHVTLHMTYGEAAYDFDIDSAEYEKVTRLADTTFDNTMMEIETAMKQGNKDEP